KIKAVSPSRLEHDDIRMERRSWRELHPQLVRIKRPDKQPHQLVVVIGVRFQPPLERLYSYYVREASRPGINPIATIPWYPAATRLWLKVSWLPVDRFLLTETEHCVGDSRPPVHR